MTENDVWFQQAAVETKTEVILGVMEVDEGMELLLEDNSLLTITMEKYGYLFPPGSTFPKKATFTHR